MKPVVVQLGLSDVAEILCRAVTSREGIVGHQHATICLLLDDDGDVVGMEIELLPIASESN